MAIIRSAIELHDSEVESITPVGGQMVVLFSAAYIHKYEGDCGTGWVQPARFVFENAEISGSLPELPSVVWDGAAIIDGKTLGLIPLELNVWGDIEVKLAFNSRHIVVIRGRRMTIELLGGAKFVENLPWKSPQVQ